MIVWMMNAGWSWLWRIAVTVAGLYTIQTVLAAKEKFVDWQTLLSIGVVVVVAIRVWSGGLEA